MTAKNKQPQVQRQKQIPFGNDNQKTEDNQRGRGQPKRWRTIKEVEDNRPEGFRSLSRDERPELFAFNDAEDIPAFAHREDDHGQRVVLAERDSGDVHDAQAELDDVRVGDLVILGSGGVLLGVCGVDAVDAGGFEEDLGADLHRAQAGRGVGGEVGVSGAGGEDDDASFFQMADGTAADVGLGDLVHLDGGHDADGDSGLLDGVLQRDGVDDGGEHSHVIGGDAVHVDGLFGDAAEEVATADDDADLAAGAGGLGDFVGDCGDEDGIDTEAAAGGQCFT